MKTKLSAVGDDPGLTKSAICGGDITCCSDYEQRKIVTWTSLFLPEPPRRPPSMCLAFCGPSFFAALLGVLLSICPFSWWHSTMLSAFPSSCLRLSASCSCHQHIAAASAVVVSITTSFVYLCFYLSKLKKSISLVVYEAGSMHFEVNNTYLKPEQCSMAQQRPHTGIDRLDASCLQLRLMNSRIV